MSLAEKKEFKDPVIIEASIVRMSSKSVCFDCEGDLEWFPKTQCNWNPDKNELEIPRWLAKEKFPNENF